MAERNITKENELKVARLRYLLKKEKEENKTTHKAIAEEMRVSRSLVTQYLNNTVPLNTDIILKFARALGVKPEDIDPELKAHLAGKEIVRVRVPVIGSMSGRLPSSNHTFLKLKKAQELLVAIESDILFATGEEDRGYIVLDMSRPPIKNDNVIYRRRDKLMFFAGKFEGVKESMYRFSNHEEVTEVMSNKMSLLAKVHEFHSTS